MSLFSDFWNHHGILRIFRKDYLGRDSIRILCDNCRMTRLRGCGAHSMRSIHINGSHPRYAGTIPLYPLIRRMDSGDCGWCGDSPRSDVRCTGFRTKCRQWLGRTRMPARLGSGTLCLSTDFLRRCPTLRERIRKNGDADLSDSIRKHSLDRDTLRTAESRFSSRHR